MSKQTNKFKCINTGLPSLHYSLLQSTPQCTCLDCSSAPPLNGNVTHQVDPYVSTMSKTCSNYDIPKHVCRYVNFGHNVVSGSPRNIIPLLYCQCHKQQFCQDAQWMYLLTEVTTMCSHYFPAASIMPQGGSYEPHHLKWDSYITYYPASKQTVSVK